MEDVVREAFVAFGPEQDPFVLVGEALGVEVVASVVDCSRVMGEDCWGGFWIDFEPQTDLMHFSLCT